MIWLAAIKTKFNTDIQSFRSFEDMTAVLCATNNDGSLEWKSDVLCIAKLKDGKTVNVFMEDELADYNREVRV